MNGDACFHCALPVDRIDEFQVEIDGDLQPVCCPGCKAVAELIRDTGMSSYYAMREAPQPGVGRPAEDSTEWQVFDREDMLDAFAETNDEEAEATIYVGGMYCAACSWLIESTLTKALQEVLDQPVVFKATASFKRDAASVEFSIDIVESIMFRIAPPAAQSTPAPSPMASALRIMLSLSVRSVSTAWIAPPIAAK